MLLYKYFILLSPNIYFSNHGPLSNNYYYNSNVDNLNNITKI